MPRHRNPNKATPWLELDTGILSIPGDGHAKQLRLNNPAWRAWLQRAYHFYVKTDAGNGFFCRKDKRLKPESAYWSAFQRHAGQVHRVYIGKDTEINMTKLQEVTQRLTTLTGEQTAEAGPTVVIGEPQIKTIRFSKGQIHFELTDGRGVSAPLEWFPRLLNASVAQRNNYRLDAFKAGAHWPDVDEDISVRVLMNLPS